MIGGTEYQQAETPFGRTGGKSKLAEKIIGLFPETSEYNTFVEPFVGAGNIFFRTIKDPRITEVINDKDIQVIRILRALKKDPISFNDKIKRDYTSPTELQVVDSDLVSRAVMTGRSTPGINHYFTGQFETAGVSALFYRQIWEMGIRFNPPSVGIRTLVSEDSDFNFRVTALLSRTSILAEQPYCYRRNTSTNTELR